MNISKYILEVNNTIYKWYFSIVMSLILVNFLVPNTLNSIGISFKLLIYILTISSALKIYYRESNLRRSVKLITPIALNHFKQIFVYLGSLLVIFWIIFRNGDALSLRSYLVDGGFSNLGIILLMFSLFFFILVSISINNRDVQYKEVKPLSSEEIKLVYKNKKENIQHQRISEEHALRHYAHLTEYESIIRLINIKDKNNLILDNGCGDGSLAILMAKRGFNVVACDISEPNIEHAKERASREGIEGKIKFLTADAENLPFSDNSFECVVSSHVLEHLPDFYRGLREVYRVTKKSAVIALPTCFNPCAWVILGGDSFWRLSRWSLTAWFVGLARVILNFGDIGVDEGYGGNSNLPHVWRYPWIMRKQLKEGGFKIIHFEASSICLPYFPFLLPVIKFLEKFKSKPIIRNFGYGSIALVEK